MKPGESIFFDTAGWVALSNKTDDFHESARRIYREIKSRQITTDDVLIETCNLFSRLPLRPLAARLMERMRGAEELGILEIVSVDSRIFEKGCALFHSRADKEWSLTDCISFVIMDSRQIRTTFTTDHHFEQAGFQILLR